MAGRSGKSLAAESHDFSLEQMAGDLRAVVEATTSGPAILLGHSIGGMIMLTFCKLYPELLGSRDDFKLVFVHTTFYTANPLKTMANSHRFLRVQKSLIEPLLYLQISLWPVVWAMDYLSYWNGTLDRLAKLTGFAGSETRAQLNFVALFYAQDSPATLAKGALAMLAFDATETLSKIKVPVLVVAGAEDPLTVLEASQKIAHDVELLGKFLILSSPAVKHFGLIEHHREFVESDFRFLFGQAI